MNIAIIKDGTCINIAVFDNLDTAHQFLTASVYQADSVLELPAGYGIGDSYDGTTWTKAPEPVEPEPEPEPVEPEVTLEERVAAIETAIMEGMTL